jgi:ABC-2 type transport system permease protein
MNTFLRSYLLLMRWTFLRNRFLVPVGLIVQIGLAVGIVVGFSLLVPAIDPVTALYLASGGPTIAVISIGLSLAPQAVASAKLDGSLQYSLTLPVPRVAMLAAEASVWMFMALPGILAGLVTAAIHLDVSYRMSPLIIPALALVAATSVGVGYAVGYALRPSVTGLVAQALIFFAIMFSPINYPATRLPGWCAGLHQVLPLASMADAVRQSLSVPSTGVDGRPFVVLGLWSVASLVVAYRFMARRG